MALSNAGRKTTPLAKFLGSDLIRQMLQFMGVGFFSLALSIIIFRFSTNRLYTLIQDGSLRLVAANSIAFAVTTTTAFFMNSRITFRAYGADLTTYIRYALINVAGFGINSGLLLLFTHALAALRHETINQMHLSFPAGEMLAYLAAVGCTFFWNFFMSRLWVFRRDEASRNRTSIARPTAAPMLLNRSKGRT